MQPKIRQTIRPSMNRPRAPNAGAMYPSRGHPARFSSSNSMVPVTRSAAHVSPQTSYRLYVSVNPRDALYDVLSYNLGHFIKKVDATLVSRLCLILYCRTTFFDSYF